MWKIVAIVVGSLLILFTTKMSWELAGIGLILLGSLLKKKKKKFVKMRS